MSSGIAVASHRSGSTDFAASVPNWSKDMNPVSRFETPCADKTTLKMQALLADLKGRVGLLNSDIAEQEERTKVHDVSAPDYSILARNLRRRRHNLLATITILQR